MGRETRKSKSIQPSKRRKSSGRHAFAYLGHKTNCVSPRALDGMDDRELVCERPRYRCLSTEYAVTRASRASLSIAQYSIDLAYLTSPPLVSCVFLNSSALTDCRTSFEFIQASLFMNWAQELVGKRVRLRDIVVLSDVVSNGDGAYLRLASLRPQNIARSESCD